MKFIYAQLMVTFFLFEPFEDTKKWPNCSWLSRLNHFLKG